jgi:hypothetical protein
MKPAGTQNQDKGSDHARNCYTATAARGLD